MAKKKIKFLSDEERQTLLTAEQSLPGLVKYIEENGTLPQEINGVQLSRFPHLNPIVAKLSDKKTYDDFIEKTADESSLTVPQLKDRLEAFEAKGTFTTQGGFSKDTIKSTLTKDLNALGYFQSVNNPAGNKAIDELAGLYASGANVTPKQANDILGTQTSKDITDYFSHFGTRMGGSEFRVETPIDTSQEVKNIQDIIEAREQRKLSEDEVAALQATLPGMMETERKRLYGGERERARNYLEFDYAPKVIEQLGKRGLEHSPGEIGSAVAQKGYELESAISQAETQQESNELSFWGDMAFQTTFDKLIESQQGVAGEAQNVRSKGLQTSQQDFQRSQNQIAQKFNLDMFRQENERALQRYRDMVGQKQSQYNRQQEAQTISDVGSAVGTGLGMALIG